MENNRVDTQLLKTMNQPIALLLFGLILYILDKASTILWLFTGRFRAGDKIQHETFVVNIYKYFSIVNFVHIHANIIYLF